MSITIDPEVLLDVRRVLLHHELVIASLRVTTPETGDTDDLTVAALDRVAAVVDGVTADLHGLAEALADLVDDLERLDDGVSAWFDLLRVRSLA